VENTTFLQTSSLLKRFRLILASIAVFTVFGFTGTYFVNLILVKGLQEINAANEVFVLTSQAIEGLEISTNNLQKTRRLQEAVEVSLSKSAFDSNQIAIESFLTEASRKVTSDPQVNARLLKAAESLKKYETLARRLYSEKSASQKQKIRSNATREAGKAKDHLRMAQVILRSHTDKLFSSIYSSRFLPLIVALTLSIVFLGFVITVGISISRKLSVSIKNLSEAAATVENGDLSHQALIIHQDELGSLTNSFNSMIRSLRQGRNRLDMLQKVTARFSQALTVEQVFDAVREVGYKTVGSDGGLISLISEDRQYIESHFLDGYEGPSVESWIRFPISNHTPATKVIKHKQSLFIERSEEITQQFPRAEKIVRDNKIESLAVIPLDVGAQCLGTIHYMFNDVRKFSREDQDYMEAMGRLCAQAIARAQLYEKTKSAVETRDEFISIASHELKTPLTPLKLQLQMLNRQVNSRGFELLTPEGLVKIVENSDKQLNRLSHLIDDLLDVSRITAGKLTLNKEKVNLAQLVREVVAQYGHQLQSALHRIEIEAEPEISAELDRLRIEQVLVNLLTNAAKYAPGKPIKVTVSNLHSLARFSISDQGPGIDKEDQSRIFKRFERIKDKTTVSGLGLGLYICNQIINAHGGQIGVESTRGKGATFYFDVPLS